MTLKMVDEGIFVDESKTSWIPDLDSIIFDCDGVLVDVSNSYDLAIQRTTSYVLKEIANIQKFDPITSKIIDGFKATGGFNDEVDLTYAAILSLAAANSLGKKGNQFILDVIQNADQSGIDSVEKYLKGLNFDVSILKNKLNYPSRHLDSTLYSIFDQIFYGPELYSKLFKKNSNFTEDGLIKNDVVIVNNKLLEVLKERFNKKIAIVSGRGKESIRYSLKDILDKFDVEHSVFLEDEPRNMAKPNPDSLIRAFKGIGATNCLFVGDSMEDLIMANKATELGYKTNFCGVIGTSKTPDEKKKLFEKKNVSLIIKSIEQLPKALNLV